MVLWQSWCVVCVFDDVRKQDGRMVRYGYESCHLMMMSCTDTFSPLYLFLSEPLWVRPALFLTQDALLVFSCAFLYFLNFSLLALHVIRRFYPGIFFSSSGRFCFAFTYPAFYCLVFLLVCLLGFSTLTFQYSCLEEDITTRAITLYAS